MNAGRLSASVGLLARCIFPVRCRCEAKPATRPVFPDLCKNPPKPLITTATRETTLPNHLFHALARHFGEDRPCLIPPGSGAYTYAEVEAQSARYAAAITGCGVKPGDRVAVQVEKSPEALFLYVGAVRAGAVFLPLNTAYTLAELDYFLGDAEPTLFVGAPEQAEVLAELAARHAARFESLGAAGEGSLPQLAAQAPGGWTDVDRSPDDLAAILYTSGTTGRSKGAMLSHANLRSNAEALVETWLFTADDVLIHALPIFHTHGLFVATNVSLLAGAAMIYLPKFDAGEVMAAMKRATVLMGVPTFYTRLLAHPGLTREATCNMRLFISGSAPLLADTHREFAARTGHAILERYGMTETGMNTSNPYEGDRVPGSVGLPLPGVSLRVTDPETGKEQAPSETGMIEVKGPNVFGGYWRMPEKTKSEFRGDGYFITGDLGTVDERGYVFILGRGKDLVISGGFNVYPKEVELEIDALPGIVESAIIGVPHADFGEAVAAIVVAGDRSLTEPQVIEALRLRLAGYKLPKRIVFVDELPRNSMAKVQKNVLRERYRDLFS
jgi:malonyl-CoA/methylmalonyl-CoA synthetase